MNDRKCDASQPIKVQYGIKSAFDYLVGEKLLNFAEAAATHPEFCARTT
jgi:phosphopantothenate synthetase